MQNNKFWQEKISINNLIIPKFMSAPIDGVTDSPTRQLIRDFSPEILLFSEMRHVALVANASEKNNKSLSYSEKEHPICFQISANKTDFISKAIEKICEKKFDALNLNAGCPAKKIIKSGTGSALMENIDQLKTILSLIKKELNNRIPLTLKIRAGFKEKNALYVSQLAQDLGVDAIIIHPRLQHELFHSLLDYDLVKSIKEKITIPVIFSGNINSFNRVKEVYEKTGVDGFMIGRALYGCPWKIREIMENSMGNNFNISEKESIDIALKHLNLNSIFYGEKYGYNIFKKQVVLYIKKIKNASQLRIKLLTSQNAIDMENILLDIKKTINNNE